MASILPPLFFLVVGLALSLAAWLLTPKGIHQTLVRTSVVLAVVCCYLMWMIAYMAQLHPLITPRMSLKAE